VVQQDFQIFQSGIIVRKNIAFAITAITAGKQPVQVADPLCADRSVASFDGALKSLGEVSFPV
jgi:hypothetical protein